MSRRQAELARSGTSAEQLQRELEKLTREQAALRQEAEELARRGAQSSVGDAARQMADATGELRRANPEAAARDGERAAAQLRRAEGQAHGSGAGTTERARTDAQIEGQQIAQEQRRIAAQAERIDCAGRPSAGEARRQLADDKGRLADRVDELRRAIGDGAETSSGGGSRRDLEDVAGRMRESARQLRDGSRGDAAIAPPEHDSARAVEDAIGQLPSSRDPGRAQLSKKLAETRAIRDCLERLEQQMRAAAAGSPAPGGRDAGRSGGQSGATRADPASTDARRTAEDYRRELEKARQALDQLAGMEATSGSGGATPEHEQFSRSAPGTEAFKQDRSDWASLRRDVDLALDRYEARVSTAAAPRRPADRLSSGGSERVPDGYEESIARYFESLAAAKRGKQ